MNSAYINRWGRALPVLRWARLWTLAGGLVLGACRPAPAPPASAPAPRASAPASPASGAPGAGDEWAALATPEAYSRHVVSPFADGVANPLARELERLPPAQRGAVIDLGTGVGSALPLLLRVFGEVVAIDASAAMVAGTRTRFRSNRRVRVEAANMLDLAAYRSRFDVALASNSLLTPDDAAIGRMLREIHGCLRPGGTFFGIFPSVEGQAWGVRATFLQGLADGLTEAEAWRRAEDLTGRHEADFVRGVLHNDGVDQKFYYRFELEQRLRRAGFQHIRFSRVRYPWRLWPVPGSPALEEQPRVWDWFVVARRDR